MKAFKLAQPKTLEGAASVLTGEFKDNKVLAGGTDLVAELKERTQQPGLVVDLKRIPGLDQIRTTERGLEIGALVTLTDLMSWPALAERWPALHTTISKTATPQVRNVGTVGGNICQRPRCWYYRDETFHCLKKGGDLCYAREGENEFHAIFENATCNIIHPSNLAPVFIAYDASFEVHGPDGTELIPAEEFFITPEEDISVENVLMPNQILKAVILPPDSASARSAYFETREKQSYDWAVCGATVNFKKMADKVVEDVRIVLSAVAPIPVRRTDLEDMVKGKRVTDDLIDKVCAAAVVDATPLRDNAYKVILLQATLRRAIRQALKA